jgi:peptidoglycan/xylan/chitin deacetylase (PgdA/CDA1 family)
MDNLAATGSHQPWPANHRAALAIVIHVDAPTLDGSPAAGSVGLDYAATGLQRLLRLLADLDVSATTAWTASALATFPQLARLAQDGGHELALSDVSPTGAENREALLARISDVPPVGRVESLSGTTGAATSRPIGLSWVITGAGGDVASMIRNSAGDEISLIPVSPYWIDTAWLGSGRPLPPSSFLEAWSLGLAAVRSEGGLMVIVLHPEVSGRPGFSSQIERFLDEAIGSGDVWIANASQIAEWSRRQDGAGNLDR